MKIDFTKLDGLIPAVIQDAETLEVLMVGFMNEEALEKTKQTLMEKGPQKVSPYSIPGIIANLAAGQVSMLHGLKGPSYCTTSACRTAAAASRASRRGTRVASPCSRSWNSIAASAAWCSTGRTRTRSRSARSRTGS